MTELEKDALYKEAEEIITMIRARRASMEGNLDCSIEDFQETLEKKNELEAQANQLTLEIRSVINQIVNASSGLSYLVGLNNSELERLRNERMEKEAERKKIQDDIKKLDGVLCGVSG